MSISLNNLEQFSVPLDGHPYAWLFLDENEALPSIEHLDQIIPLNEAASDFLMTVTGAIDCTDKQFKTLARFSDFSDQQQVKKYLYNLGIPFEQKVFVRVDIGKAFMLTWKMVIKYADSLFFANDQIVHDSKFNWALAFDHNDIFTFGQHPLDGAIAVLTNNEQTRVALAEMTERMKNKL